MDTPELKNILESLLFVSDSPVTLKQFKQILEDIPVTDIRNALTEMAYEYEIRVGGFYLSEVAGGYQLRTRPQYKEHIKRLIRNRPIKLSRAGLETLAIIAYKQPTTRAEVELIRGVDSGGIIRTLTDYKLIKIIGRKEIPGRPMLYITSKRFLEIFDLNDLKDLPSLNDIKLMEQRAIENVPIDQDMKKIENQNVRGWSLKNKRAIKQNKNNNLRGWKLIE